MTWRRGRLERQQGRVVIVVGYDNPPGLGLPPRVVEWHELAAQLPPELELELAALELENVNPGAWIARRPGLPDLEIRTRRRPLINPTGSV